MFWVAKGLKSVSYQCESLCVHCPQKGRQDTDSQHTSVQHSLFTSAERIARAWLKNCISSLCAWKESVIWWLHMSHPFLFSHLPFPTITSSSSFSLRSTATPEHALQSGQHDLLQEQPVHPAHLQAPSVDKLRHQESLWREDLQSGGNPLTTTPTLSRHVEFFSQISLTDIRECRARDEGWRQNTSLDAPQTHIFSSFSTRGRCASLVTNACDVGSSSWWVVYSSLLSQKVKFSTHVSSQLTWSFWSSFCFACCTGHGIRHNLRQSTVWFIVWPNGWAESHYSGSFETFFDPLVPHVFERCLDRPTVLKQCCEIRRSRVTTKLLAQLDPSPFTIFRRVFTHNHFGSSCSVCCKRRAQHFCSMIFGAAIWHQTFLCQQMREHSVVLVLLPLLPTVAAFR